MWKRIGCLGTQLYQTPTNQKADTKDSGSRDSIVVGLLTPSFPQKQERGREQGIKALLPESWQCPLTPSKHLSYVPLPTHWLVSDNFVRLCLKVLYTARDNDIPI